MYTHKHTRVYFYIVRYTCAHAYVRSFTSNRFIYFTLDSVGKSVSAMGVASPTIRLFLGCSYRRAHTHSNVARHTYVHTHMLCIQSGLAVCFARSLPCLRVSEQISMLMTMIQQSGNIKPHSKKKHAERQPASFLLWNFDAMIALGFVLHVCYLLQFAMDG